jgi:molecular chaperone GrpE (heat shock protein)
MADGTPRENRTTSRKTSSQPAPAPAPAATKEPSRKQQPRPEEINHLAETAQEAIAAVKQIWDALPKERKKDLQDHHKNVTEALKILDFLGVADRALEASVTKALKTALQTGHTAPAAPVKRSLTGRPATTSRPSQEASPEGWPEGWGKPKTGA